MTILSTMRQFVPVYLQNINICLSHVPTPRGLARKEAARVCGGCVCPLYAASDRVCVCACVYALKVVGLTGWQVVRVVCIGGRFAIVWPCIQFVCVQWARLCVGVGCLCVCVQCANGYLCAGCFAVNVFVCVCVRICARLVGICGQCVCVGVLRAGQLDNPFKQHKNESQNESENMPKTNRNTDSQIVKNAGFLRL